MPVVDLKWSLLDCFLFLIELVSSEQSWCSGSFWSFHGACGPWRMLLRTESCRWTSAWCGLPRSRFLSTLFNHSWIRKANQHKSEISIYDGAYRWKSYHLSGRQRRDSCLTAAIEAAHNFRGSSTTFYFVYRVYSNGPSTSKFSIVWLRNNSSSEWLTVNRSIKML